MNLKQHIKNERGQTMTELTLVAPVLLLILFGIIQFGIVFNNYVTLTDAARAASRKGAVSRSASDPKGTCESAGYAAGPGLDQPGVKFIVTCTPSGGWAAGTDVTVSASYPWSINLVGFTVASGTLNTTMKERVE
jgi:Flp pilus assembly protein TadG